MINTHEDRRAVALLLAILYRGPGNSNVADQAVMETADLFDDYIFNIKPYRRKLQT